MTEIPVGPIHAGIIEPAISGWCGRRHGAIWTPVNRIRTGDWRKISEGQPLAKALFIAERICGVCALSHAVAYAQAVESAAATEAPCAPAICALCFWNWSDCITMTSAMSAMPAPGSPGGGHQSGGAAARGVAAT